MNHVVFPRWLRCIMDACQLHGLLEAYQTQSRIQPTLTRVLVFYLSDPPPRHCLMPSNEHWQFLYSIHKAGMRCKSAGCNKIFPGIGRHWNISNNIKYFLTNELLIDRLFENMYNAYATNRRHI